MPATAAFRDPWVSERLIYRALEEEDEAFILDKFLKDAATLLNLTTALPVPQGKKHGKELYEKLNKNTLMAAIVCQPVLNLPGAPPDERPKPIGLVCLLGDPNRENGHHHRSMLGIMIAPEFQSQGYGSEAINWALDFGFTYGNLHRIGLEVWGHNEAAQRLYKKLGFTVDGRDRDYFWLEGQFQDRVLMSILEDEWRERKATNSGIAHR